jgi:hypothetical protein
LAAIKLLEWDREWNLLTYYGLQEYGRRWWSSRKAIQSDNDGNAKVIESATETQNKAQVAFMITSEQRQILSNHLGYSAQDIRSFKPIEALLLVKHSVKKESDVPSYDFRNKLKELNVENDQLMRAQHAKAQKQVPTNDGLNQSEKHQDAKVIHSLSPEEVQRAQIKPDIALALMNAEKDEEVNFSNFEINEVKMKDEQVESPKIEQYADTLVPDPGTVSATPSASSNIDPGIKPWESEQLHMKPDVAAAVFSSQQHNNMEQETVTDFDNDDESDEPCWYEVIEVVPLASSVQPEGERVIALFANKNEAVQCVRIKESFRSRGEKSEDAKGNFIIRRRWNA